MNILKEAERLYRQGYAVHWLKPKSKKPVDSGWTTGPRKEWIDLKRSYRPGFNVGVRLGNPSKLKSGFLGVIDCDVKSTDPRHKAEMIRSLRSLFPESTTAPAVLSGRGNGSRHIYVVTKTPGVPARLTQSSEMVEVKMAGKPSNRDLKMLGKPKTNEGWKLRPAWEISFMGEGQQVVLPPSIHPDSGKPYRWGREGEPRAYVGPKGTGERAAPSQAEVRNFRVNFNDDIDLDLLPIASADIELIRDGKDCTDRSAGLFVACRALVKAGLNDDDILSILTNRENFLGDAGFDHAQTENRTRAARWVKRYTLDTVRADLKIDENFEREVEVSELNPAEAVAQAKSLEPHWETRLERNNFDVPKNTLKNVILILENQIGKEIFRHNQFSGSDIYGAATPWGGRIGSEVTDRDIIRMKTWVARKFRFEPSNDRLNEAVMDIATRNGFHPVRTYLDSLEWDGKPRVERFLETYFHAQGDKVYLRAISKKVLCAMVARIYQPGVKFDNILILEGKQGLGKSTAIKELASAEWFSDAPINVADKDSVMALQGNWVLELGEIASMRKADLDLLKAYVSRSVDKIRVPYGKRTETFPRQCIFIGSKNPEGEYLKDPTGNRRYWPTTILKSDHRGVRRDRDQLLAEAKELWEMGETLYLDDERAILAATNAQEERTVRDILVEQAQSFFAKLAETPEKERTFPLEGFTMHEALKDEGPFPGLSSSGFEVQRAGAALRNIGFESVNMRVNGKQHRVWVAKKEIAKDENGKDVLVKAKPWVIRGVTGNA